MSVYSDGNVGHATGELKVPPGDMEVSATVGRDFTMSDLDPGIAMGNGGVNSGLFHVNYHNYEDDAQDRYQYDPSMAAVQAEGQQQLDGGTGGGPVSSAGNVVSNNVTATDNSSVSGPGAGPLPTGFGATPVSNGGSSVTEFTKRRNWPQRVLEEVKDFLHILSPDGRIVYVSPSAEVLTGYMSEELVGKFIYTFIHHDDSAIFSREFNESIASGNVLRFFYRFRKADGTFGIFESHGHPHLTTETVAFGPNNTAGFCRGFFMMARPYPTKNAQLLDSFLEHKIENERLTRRIADLRREEREEDEAAQQAALRNTQGTPSDTAESPHDVQQPTQDQLAMPPPSKPGIPNAALTKNNLETATASQQQDSINDKMARYEGATHLETIEMLTGLRYRDGERSQGISTGETSPALIRGDAGIVISADKDHRGDKKKKSKLADEYVCTDCGTLDSPEWRKGPSGPKTLCNACGLRWAKKEKKRSNSTPGGEGHATPSMKHSNSQDTQGSG